MLPKFQTLFAFSGIFLMTFLSACNQPVPVIPTPDLVGTVVAATLTANALLPTVTLLPTETTLPPAPSATATVTPSPAPTETPTPEPLQNNVAGKVCFPGGEIPAMTVFFEDAEAKTETVVEIQVTAGQGSYETILPPGTYIAYAWLTDFSRGGLYSRAVPCGLKASCEDHAPQTFVVAASEAVSGIDLCDWYAGPFNVPYPPGKDPEELTGNVAGNIVYSDGAPPALRVVAFNEITNYYYWVNTLEGKTSYVISDLPAGTYTVVAYDDDGHVGGHAASDHSLIVITVKAGETTSGVNINDWDLPAGAFPPDPTR